MLKPVVLIQVFNRKGEQIGFGKAPYNGDQEQMTEKVEHLLKKYDGAAYALPVTGFESYEA